MVCMGTSPKEKVHKCTFSCVKGWDKFGELWKVNRKDRKENLKSKKAIFACMHEVGTKVVFFVR